MNFEQWLINELCASNLVTKIQLDKALQIQKSNKNEALIDVLVEYAYISEEQAQGLKKQFTAPEVKTVVFSKSKQVSQIHDKKPNKAENQFDRYSILKLLGEGCFGKVYLALDSQTKKRVALKIFSPESVGDGKHLARFEREIKAVAQLVHPNIVNVYDVGSVGDQTYFTMKYVRGDTLEKVIEQGKNIPSRQCAEIVLQVARALDYAHANNIIHRDIKPANVMIDEDNIAYVMDFGLAREISGGDKITETGSILGTPAYMSPEQASGKNKTLDGRSDVYSLGATFYYTLTGQQVFDGTSAVEVIQKIIAQLPLSPREIVPDIPEALENICLKALRKDKNKRYANCAEMAEDLEVFITGKKTKKIRFSLANFFNKS